MTARLQHPTKIARQAAYWRRAGDTGTAERLEKVLNANGRCRRCGRALTDPESIELGEGPECRRRDREHRIVADDGTVMVCSCGARFLAGGAFHKHRTETAGA